MEIVSLFERPITPLESIGAESQPFTLIREKNFFEVFKQVKEILIMTINFLMLFDDRQVVLLYVSL